jgi:hypothetical protein
MLEDLHCERNYRSQDLGHEVVGVQNVAATTLQVLERMESLEVDELGFVTVTGDPEPVIGILAQHDIILPEAGTAPRES